MSAHVAIIHRAILAGRKTVEARLSRDRREPFGRIARGDEIFFKIAGGGFCAVARVARVLSVSGLTPDGVRALRRRVEGMVLGGPGFWSRRRRARYATLIWIEEVRQIRGVPRGDGGGPDYEAARRRRPRAAWHVLDADQPARAA
jgi:hypothetical protein